MEKSNATPRILRTLSIVFALMAVATAIPFSHAGEPCILGYKSLCPFMPVSTLITLYVSVTLHRYLQNMG